MENREKIEELLFNKYLDKDINIILKNVITTEFVIHNSKILINKNTLMITDTREEEFIINLSFVTDTKIINNSITFELDEQLVTLDY